MPVEHVEGDPAVWIFDRARDVPLYRADCQLGSFILTQVDQRGVSTGKQKVNMDLIVKKSKSSLPLDPLAEHFIAFALPLEVDCSVDLQTGLIDFLRIPQASFKRTEHGFESVEHPGFYLTDLPTLPLLNGLIGGLVLENFQEEQMLLLWNCTLYRKEDFSAEVFPVEGEGRQIHAFKVDPVTRTLQSSDNEANLYASYLFKMQRAYEKALYYLSKVSALEGVPESSFSKFQAIHDSSPASLGFNMKLIHRLVSVESHLSEKTLTRGYHNVLLPWGWMSQTYIDYLRALSDDALSAVPRALRLTKGEEKILLSYFKRRNKLPQPLENRYVLLTRLRGEMEVEIPAREVSEVPSPYRFLRLGRMYLFELVGPSLLEEERNERQLYTYVLYPTRLSELDIRVHFPELYMMAKSANPDETDPFDFTLLTILRQSRSWGTVLLIVRRFPKKFAHLGFRDPTDPEQTKSDWKEIRDTFYALIRDSEVQTYINAGRERNVTFSYEKSLTLQFPNPDSPRPFQEVVYGREQNLAPLASSILGLFIEERRPLSQVQVKPTPPKRASQLERELYRNLEKGLQEMPTTHTVYHFHSEQIQAVEMKLAAKLFKQRAALRIKRARILEILNHDHDLSQTRITPEGLDREIQYKLDTKTYQTAPLLPETVMKEVVLKNDLGFLRARRPLLSEDGQVEVIRQVKEYYYELMVAQMTKEALDLLQKCHKEPDNLTHQKNLAKLMHYQFLPEYDPYVYPEIAYFKVTNGKHPREEQLRCYLWICEGIEKGENRLFQLQAGGGKTSYLAPLVMLRARMMGYLPVFMSTQAIYPIDKANLNQTLKTLEDYLGLLEVGMHMKLSADDLQMIFDHLKIYYERGDKLILTPQICYSLHLLYQYAAFQERDEEKVKWLSLIFALLNKKERMGLPQTTYKGAFLIVDESHRNLDALTRAIYGIGELERLPKKELKLFVEMMKPLLGVQELFCEDGVSVAERGRLQTNTQGVAGPAEIKAVRAALAGYMLDLLQIPADDRAAFKTYWTDKRAPQPHLLRTWAKKDRKKADAAALVHYFLHTLFPQIVKMRSELDHAPSVYEEEEFDAPCHHKTPSTAQFEDAYRSVALSIKGTFHRGLSEGQVRVLLTEMIKKERAEQPKVPPLMPTPTMQKFRKWMNDPEISIRQISLHSGSWRQVYETISRHPKAIETYLLDHILPQIAQPTELMSATPVDILSMFALSVSFSATPYSEKCYPLRIDSYKFDRGFEAQVVSELCKEENQEAIFPLTTDLEAFFIWLAEEHGRLLGEVDVLIDPGGFFCDHTNEHVARTWLESAELDGAIFFQQGDALSVDRNEKICLLLRKGQKVEKHLLDGNQLIEVLEKQELDYYSMRIGTFYDAAHTESADIIQKERTKALVFGGDTLTSSHLIQAVMRLRGFLDPERDQTLAWVFQRDLAAKIGSINGWDIYRWALKNEEREMKKRVILTAFQEISYHIQQIAGEETEGELRDPAKQIEIMEEYRGGFCQHSPHDPYGRYAEPEQAERADKVLWAYAKDEYERFSYAISFTRLRITPTAFLSETQAALIPAIKEVIRKTEEALKYITTSFRNKVSQEVEQQTQIMREVEKEQYRPRPRDPRSAAQIFGEIGIDDPSYPNHEGERPSRQIFSEPRLTPRLYFEDNQLRTANEGSVALGAKFIKPIDFFVIVHYEGRYWAHAVVNEIVSSYVETLSEEVADPDLKHTAFILTSEGQLYIKGKGNLEPAPEIVEEVLHSQWLQDLVIDAALLRGEVRHPERLEERIKRWPTFPKFWERIMEALPNPEAANDIIIKQMIKKIYPKEPKKRLKI